MGLNAQEILSPVITFNEWIAGEERNENILPATGGIGVNIFYATGALLVIGSLFLAVMKGFKR